MKGTEDPRKTENEEDSGTRIQNRMLKKVFFSSD